MISMTINASSITAWATGSAVVTFARAEHVAQAVASCEPQTDCDALSWRDLGRSIGAETFARHGAGAVQLAAGVVASVANQTPSILAQQIVDAMDSSSESRLMLREFAASLARAVMARDNDLAHILRRDSGVAVLDGASSVPPRFVVDDPEALRARPTTNEKEST